MHGGIYRCTGIYFFKSAQKFTLLKLTLLASKMDLQKFSLSMSYFFNFFICSGPLLLPFFRDPTALFRLSQGIQDAPAKS